MYAHTFLLIHAILCFLILNAVAIQLSPCHTIITLPYNYHVVIQLSPCTLSKLYHTGNTQRMKFHVRDTILLWQTCTTITCLQIQSVPISRTIITIMIDGMSSLVSECLIQMAMVEEYQNKWEKKKDWTCRMVLFPPLFLSSVFVL